MINKNRNRICIDLGGLIFSSKLAAASPLIGSDVPIFVITAVLLGRTTIGGGYGDVLKTLSGIFLITLIKVSSKYKKEVSKVIEPARKDLL